MIEITFDSEVTCDEEHKYWRRMVNVPGVTESLSRTGIAAYPDIPQVINGRNRGRAVHKTIQFYEKGTLDERCLTEDYLRDWQVGGFLDGYKRFKDAWIAKIVNVELMLFHSLFFYAGQLDLLAITLDGRLVIFDFKTGAIPWWVVFQTSAYLEALLNQNKQLQSDQIWHGAVGLNPDGSFDPPRIEQDRRGFGIFQQALNIVHCCNKRSM